MSPYKKKKRASILKEIVIPLRKTLRHIYGSRLVGLRIYGSYARGEEKKNSDLDMAMILKDFDTAWREIERTSEIVSDLSLASGITVSLIPVRFQDWRNKDKPLIRNIRREGLTTL